MGSVELRRAFGVSFASELALPGLAPLAADAALGADPTRIVPACDLAADWPAAGGERVVQSGPPGTADEQFVERHPRAGHRLVAGGFGAAIISPDAREVRYAGEGGSPARLERFLIGRVLPWTAQLRGRELLHAAGVTLEGRAVLLLGPSGAGKTSLAVQLVLAGAGFLSDDVIAVESDGRSAPLAHPGSRVAGLRVDERTRLDRGERTALGPLRELDGKAYATFAVAPEPVPVGAVVFVTRSG